MSVLFTGLLSIAQMTVVPGYLLLRYVRALPEHVLLRLVYTMGASLIANHALVVSLTAAGVYTRPVLFTIIGAEVCALLWIWKGHRWRSTSTLRLSALSDHLPEGAARRAIFTAALIAALTAIAVYLGMVWANWGSVFRYNDDVASWDRWAMEWASNSFPGTTNWYPQLLPANWSISYVLLGTTDIKMFAKAIMPLFGLAPMLLLFSAGWRRREAGLLLAVPVYAYIFLHYIGEALIMSGYVETALAFFAFLPFHAAWTGKDAERPSRLGLAMLFATGCALVKQGGLPFFLATLVFGVVWWRRGVRLERRQLMVVLAAVVVALGWYIGKAIQVQSGADSSNLTLLTQGLHAGRSYWQRIGHSVEIMRATRGLAGPFVFAALTVLTLSGLLFRATRWVAALVVIPYFFLWAMFFSYEVRTVSTVFGYAAFVAGVATGSLLEIAGVRVRRSVKDANAALAAAAAMCCVAIAMQANWPEASGAWKDEWLTWARQRFGQAMVGIALAVFAWASLRVKGEVLLGLNWVALSLAGAVFAGVLAAGPYRDETILRAQLEQQRQIGSASVNRKIYEIDSATPIQGEILTDYWFLRALPGLKQHFQTLYCETPCPAQRLVDLVKARPSVSYVLIADPVLEAGAAASLEAQGLQTMFVEDNMRFLRVNRQKN